MLFNVFSCHATVAPLYFGTIEATTEYVAVERLRRHLHDIYADDELAEMFFDAEFVPSTNHPSPAYLIVNDDEHYQIRPIAMIE